MRHYNELEVDTIEDADLFLPGMHVLMGDSDSGDEWTVEKIEPHNAGFLITVYRDY